MKLNIKTPIWAIIQKIIPMFINFIIFLILVSLLKPSDFGILTMAISWITFIQVFSDMGFGSALVQKKNVESRHFSTIFVINIISGIILTIIGINLSYVCAVFFKTPDVQKVMSVLSLIFIINSFSLTHIAISRKKMQFRELAVRDILANLIGGIMGIIFAYFQYGLWSLVIQSLLTSIVGTFLIWKISKWRPTFKEFSLKYADDLWAYSSNILIFNIFKYITQNIDKLLIGYLLGPLALGFYAIAFKIMIFPVNTVNLSIGNYLFPKFSSMQDDLESVRYLYILTSKVLNNLIVVLSSTIICIIPIIIEQKWIPIINLLPFLGIVAIAQSIISPTGQLMKALNRPDWLVKWSFFLTLICVVAILIGSKYNIRGVVISISIAHIIALCINFVIVKKIININIYSILKQLGVLFISCIPIFLFIIIIIFHKNAILNNKFYYLMFFSLSLMLYFMILIHIDRRLLYTTKIILKKLLY